ncbi:MAG: transposase [Verrucomicrobia bacterium]|nr:transposase [Verrucomicrobiota bacterium]
MSISFRYFDPDRHTSVTRSHLPHWDQAEATYFITWRTFDSIPKTLWMLWQEERRQWLSEAGVDPCEPDWRQDFERLDESKRREFSRKFSAKLEAHLDAGHGACVLRDPTNARIVADSLHHFDGIRYRLGEYVVMPNHVHVIVGGIPRDRMLKQVEGWKRYTARLINELLGQKGRFWQDESFDHLVRNAEAHQKFRRYLAGNPFKAGLHGGYLLHMGPGPVNESS